MKRGVLVLALFVSLFLVNFISAQFFGDYGLGGYGGRISLADFFDSLDPSTVTYGLLFFIFFTVIFFILSKVNLFSGRRTPWGGEEPNTVAAGVVAFAVSGLIVYYIYRNGYNFESFFYEIGFSGELFSFVLGIIFVLIALVVIKKFKVPGFLIILGLLFIFAGFTNLIEEKTTAIFIGAILFIIGIFLAKNVRKWWKKNIWTD